MKINEISDSGLKAIKMKYWDLRHKAFLDEHGISDEELINVWKRLDDAEGKEIVAYLKEQSE